MGRSPGPAIRDTRRRSGGRGEGMAAVHLAEGLADGIDALLTAAAAVAFLRRRGLLPLVVLLLAADPLWSLGLQALGPPLGLESTPLRQVVTAVLSDAPLWGAFALGLSRLLGPEPRPGPSRPGVAGR